MRNKQERIEQTATWQRLCEYCLYTLVVSSLIFGGTPSSAGWRTLLICAVAAITLAMAVAAGATERLKSLPLLLRLALLAVIILPLLQVIPLPPELWRTLPGRELSVRIFELLSLENGWHPISVVPRDTLFAFLMLLPPAAALLAVSTLDPDGRKRLVAVFIAVVVASVFIGLVQFGSGGSTLDFYDTAHRGSFLGFFANRNHQGLLMGIGGVFALALVNEQLKDPRISLATSILVAIVFMIAAVGTLSRAGIGLTFLGIGGSLYITYVHGRLNWITALALAVLILAIIYFATFSATAQSALDRFSQIEESGRLVNWERTTPLIAQYFPWGAGVGSFTDIYPPIEQLNAVTPRYYNRVHNDYLELLMETGAPGLLVLSMMAALIVWRGLKAYHGKDNLGLFGLAAFISIGLVGLHSTVDYPLRTLAHATVFSICLALFFTKPVSRRVKTPGLDTPVSGARSSHFTTIRVAGLAAILFLVVSLVQFQSLNARLDGIPSSNLVGVEGETLSQGQLAKAKRILAREPLDQELLNAIYASEVRQGLDDGQRQKYIEALSQLGWRDTSTQQNLLFEAASRNQLEPALDRMDALMRRNKLVDEIMLVLAQLEVDPAGMQLVADRLDRMPNWRERYLAYSAPLANPQILDARLRLFDLMTKQGMEIGREEFRAPLYALLDAGRRADIAKVADTEFQAGEGALLYDPDFERMAGVPREGQIRPLPFEWRLTNRSGVSSQIIAEEWSSRLIIRWNGRGAPTIARTLTFLREGQRPELEVLLSAGSQLRGVDSLRFSLVCPDARAVRFARKEAGTSASPGMDRRSAYYEAENASSCDYPEIFIGGRPQVGDRGADLSIDSIKLTLQ